MSPYVWIAGGAAVATGILLATKKAKAAAPTPEPLQTAYGEQTRVVLPVPAGWRRVTNAEVSTLPELGAAANSLRNTPGFTSMQYGTLAPFVASDGKTYATWIEQHYHPPEGPVKPWGYHHGVTLLARIDTGLSGEIVSLGGTEVPGFKERIERTEAAVDLLISEAERLIKSMSPRELDALRLGLTASHLEESIVQGDWQRARAHADRIFRVLKART